MHLDENRQCFRVRAIRPNMLESLPQRSRVQIPPPQPTLINIGENSDRAIAFGKSKPIVNQFSTTPITPRPPPSRSRSPRPPVRSPGVHVRSNQSGNIGPWSIRRSHTPAKWSRPRRDTTRSPTPSGLRAPAIAPSDDTPTDRTPIPGSRPLADQMSELCCSAPFSKIPTASRSLYGHQTDRRDL